MNGSLTLTLAAVDGRTRPIHVVAVPPLQCSRARYDDPRCPNAASLTLLHLGGVLQGDQLALDITAETGASANLTTAAATQVYRMPEREAAQHFTITVYPGAQLRYLPEPTILFAEARYTQTMRITLHPDAKLVIREIMVGGRLARGELHRYERYRSQFEVHDERGRCLLSERGLVEPANTSPANLGVQSGYPVVGSLYMLARGAPQDSSLECAWRALAAHPSVVAGAGMLPNDCGILVRALGSSAPTVRAALDAVLHALESAAR